MFNYVNYGPWVPVGDDGIVILNGPWVPIGADETDPWVPKTDD